MFLFVVTQTLSNVYLIISILVKSSNRSRVFLSCVFLKGFKHNMDSIFISE